MQKAKAKLMLCTFGFASLLVTASAEAKCTGDKLRFSPINNDTVSISLDCDAKGQNKKFKPGAGYAFTGVSVVKAPASGTLSTEGYGFKYKPRKGFSGSDAFTVRVCGTKGGQSGCSTLNYRVSVG